MTRKTLIEDEKSYFDGDGTQIMPKGLEATNTQFEMNSKEQFESTQKVKNPPAPKLVTGHPSKASGAELHPTGSHEKQGT